MRLVDNAVRCSLAASLAYLSPEQLASAKKEWQHTGAFTSSLPGQLYMSRLAGAGFSYAEQVLEPSLQSSATIFTNEAENEVCVAFRGSTALTNFKSMFALGLVPLSNDNVGNGDGDVPEGGGELAWNFLDHTRYLGTYLGPRVSVGKVRWTRLLKPNYRP